jgi:hypothetical protein
MYAVTKDRGGRSGKAGKTWKTYDKNWGVGANPEKGKKAKVYGYAP